MLEPDEKQVEALLKGITSHGAILDELYLNEDRIERIIEGIDDLFALQ